MIFAPQLIYIALGFEALCVTVRYMSASWVRRFWLRCSAFFVLLLLPVWTVTARAGEPDAVWKYVTEKDGIAVWAKEEPHRTLPTFRGIGLVDGGLLEVLAVFEDGSRHTQWVHACKESWVIKRISENEAYWYSLTDAPWPVSDRDSVVHSKLSLDPRRRIIWNRFRQVDEDLVPQRQGVIRTPDMEGYFKLEYVTPKKTRVVYQVSVDPGGWLPTWLVRMATKDLPIKTIRNLRAQLEATRGEYTRYVAHWAKMHGLQDYVAQPPRHGVFAGPATAETSSAP